MSESDGEFPFFAVILLVLAFLTLLIGGCTCFVLCCFTAENTKGPQYFPTSKGARWINRPTVKGPRLRYNAQEDPSSPRDGEPIVPKVSL